MLPCDPPVPIMTALRARILRTVPAWVTAIPSTRPEVGSSRWIAVMRCSSKIRTPARPQQLRAVASARCRSTSLRRLRIGGCAGLYQRPLHGGRVHFARRGVADRVPTAFVGRLIDEHDAVRDEPLVCRHVVSANGARLAIVVAVIGMPVRFDDRPVGQVPEQQVGRVDDAVFLLRARAAAERNVPPLVIAWPPMSFSASTTITEAPASRAAIAAGSPTAPEPITTTSASSCQVIGSMKIAVSALPDKVGGDERSG